MQSATVAYQVTTYRGEVTVSCADDDDNDSIIAKAKAQLTRQIGPLPMGYESWEVIDRRKDGYVEGFD